ncbi:hypothetical protein L3i20_v224110 [Paenibacillus sp. L3-i20]|nr:hypothetical protein L3i20_v224110 [Paenibacillus sp. L3-i20]
MMYYPYVALAQHYELIDNKETKFYPDRLIKREELASFLIRALDDVFWDEYKKTIKIKFKDEKMISKKEDAALAVGLGVLNAKDGNFRPTKELTRAEAANTVYQFLIAYSLLKQLEYD